MSHLITQVGCYGVFPRINPQRPAEMVYMAVGGGAQVCQGGGGRSEGVRGVGVMGEGHTREDEGFLQDTERKYQQISYCTTNTTSTVTHAQTHTQ